MQSILVREANQLLASGEPERLVFELVVGLLGLFSISLPGWGPLPGALALTRTGLSPARRTRLSGRTMGELYKLPMILLRGGTIVDGTGAGPDLSRRPAR